MLMTIHLFQGFFLKEIFLRTVLVVHCCFLNQPPYLHLKVILIFRLVAVVGFILFSYGASVSQKLVYRIEHNADSIGYFTAEKKRQGAREIYQLESHTNFTLLMSFKHYAYYRSEYENSQLMDAIMETFLNDKARSQTETIYENGKYLIKTGESNQLQELPINESIATLYFRKPRGTKIFSERHGSFFDVRKVSESEFELIKPDKRKNIYYFDGNLCKKVTVHMALATIHLVRINN